MTDHSQRPTATIYQLPARKAVRRAEPRPVPHQTGADAERAPGIIDGPCWYHEEAIAARATDDRRR